MYGVSKLHIYVWMLAPMGYHWKAHIAIDRATNFVTTIVFVNELSKITCIMES